MTYNSIPEEMKALRQWVCWGAQGNPLKKPFNPSTGQPAKAGQPETWAEFPTACEGVKQTYYSGIGFEFAQGGGLVGIDFDHCITDGQISPEVAAWVEAFNSYTEVSPSGTGLHIFCKGTLPGNAVKTKFAEMYDRQRYFTMTGNSYGTVRPLREAQEAINSLYRRLSTKREKAENKPTGGKEGVPLTDQQIIDIASRASNGAQFLELWEGRWQQRYQSQSEADLALCNMLAFYCGKDTAQMDRLFRSSALMRDKWDRAQNGSTYGAFTIQKAVADCGKVFDPRTTAGEAFDSVPEEKDRKPYTLNTIAARELQNKEISPPRYAVVDMLPQGLSILASPPKYGKSWFVLDLCLSVAAGTMFLNHQTVKNGCLYMALEDSEWRLKDRMNSILAGKEAPGRFDFVTSALEIGHGLIEQLETYIKEKPDTGLIVIDTLQKVRSPSNGKETAYGTDYREIGILKNFADRHKICMVLVHHLRKMGDDSDPFNRISGTNGLMGAADTVFVMTRSNRCDNKTTLFITGRDVESRETVIQFHKDTHRWQVLGDASWLAEQRARAEYSIDPIVATIKKLLDQNNGRWSGRMQELLDAGKILAGTYLAENTRALSSKVIALEKPLFDYDHILHTRAKNGNAGGKHHFYYGCTVGTDSSENSPITKGPNIK